MSWAALNRLIASLAVLLGVAACGGGGSGGMPQQPTSRPDATTTSTQTTVTPATVDCAQPADDIEKMVCADPELAALDRRVDELFQQIVHAVGADPEALTAEQRGWKSGRNDCWKAADAGRCVLEAYQTRVVELQIKDEGGPAPKPVDYRCARYDRPVTGVFYNDTEPRAMMLTVGGDQAILIAQPTASGIHYSRVGADYAEHQGDIRIEFYGSSLSCTAG